MEASVFRDIAERTGGDIYVGVVGPVRTGKSTLIKGIMEKLVIPNISDSYRRERARDELPQCGSGKTIMTAEPKFVPEEAVELSLDEVTKLRVRMIDSVGYMVPGAVGATEEGQPRMVTTPWFDYEIPMSQAAEIGTKKVMEEHCSVGLVVTTDGTITDISREDYREAEQRAIRDMQATGKPFVVVVNSRDPEGEQAQLVGGELNREFGVQPVVLDGQSCSGERILGLLEQLLYAFPMQEMRILLPNWVNGLEFSHPIKTELCRAVLECAGGIVSLRDAEGAVGALLGKHPISGAELKDIDLGHGSVTCALQLPEELYYEILSQKTGFTITDEGMLMELLTELSAVKASYDRISDALEQTKATGYGIVMPDREDMKLESPELIHKGNAYGVKLKAAAPSIHMIRVDLDAEVSPMVGTEQQSRDLLGTLGTQFESDKERLWESNIFGKTVYEMVSDGLNTKVRRMPEEVRMKFRNSLGRTVNEGANGMICILF